ncbi:protein FAM210B, mitochondrial [Symphorus nematophorus]
MFLCRTGRLSAAALDLSFKSTGSFLLQVKTNRLRDVSLTLRKDHTFQAHRCFCVSDLRKQQADLQPVQNWDSSTGFVITDWAHLDRVAAVAVNLSKGVQREAENKDIITLQPLIHAARRFSGRREPVGNGLFTGNWGVSSPRCSTRTMHTRATKKSDAAEEQTADNNKEDEQNLKEASPTSSSTAKASGEPEPEEGGKPTKTQQLKKVFKEYGAVGVSFHICISLMSLGMFYLLISSGIDMAAVLCKLGFSEAVVRSKMAAGTSTFVLAYAIHKLFAPVRISITLVSVPLIVRYFRKTGLFKPPTPAP